MADYRIDVDTNIDTSKLDAFESKIKSLNDTKVNIKFDTDKGLDDLKSKLSGSKQKVKINADVVPSKKAMMSLTRDITSLTKRIGEMEVSPKINNNQIASYEKQLTKLQSRWSTAFDKFGSSLSDGEAYNIAREFEKAFDTLDTLKAKNIDLGIAEATKKESAEAQAEFKRLNKLYDNIFSDKKRLLSSNIGSTEFKEVEQSIARMQKDADALFDSMVDAGRMSDKMMSALSDKEVFQNQELSRLKAKNVDFGIAEAVKKEEAEASAAFSRLKGDLNELYSIQRKQLKLDVNSDEYKQLEIQAKSLKTTIDSTFNSVAPRMTDTQFDELVKDAEKAGRSADELKAKLTDAKRAIATGFSKQLQVGDFGKQFDTLKTKLESLDRVPKELQKSFGVLETQYSKLSNIDNFINTGDYDAAIRSVEKYKDTLRTVENQISSATKQQQQLNRSLNQQNATRSLENAKKTFSLQIDNWLNNNSAAVEQFGDRLNSIKSRIADVSNSADLSALRSEFTQTTLEAKNADVAMLSFGDRLKRKFREYFSYVGIAGVFAAGSQAVRMMAQNVLEVDTAMTGLYRVTDLTAAQYDKLYSDMISASKEYGSTLTDTINATADWVRAGFDADTALGLADVTAMYQHVSDLDYSEASENLLTAYNGFKDSFNVEFGGDAVASVEHIADAFNELDNKYSVTSAGLGEGLARSASALQLAGNTFEESAALVGATSEITQNPEKAGNAMKVLSLRIRGELYNTPPYREIYRLCYVA